MEALKVHLSRFICRDVASNLDQMDAHIALAASNGAQVCVFPESFLHGYKRPIDAHEVRLRITRASAAHPTMTLIPGSFSEGGFNRMTVWRAGREVASYDKVHLFLPNGEGELWSVGNRYVAVKDGNWTLGLINCNDLRFPEQARALRLQGGANLLVVIAWWPWRRTHLFEALLQARAIENGCFVVGCCITASEGEEAFQGAGTYAFDPLGDPIRTSDDVTFLLDPGCFQKVVVDTVREYVPITQVDVCAG